MELTHTFTVPSDVATTWASFQDIAALAECFPGAQVTSVGETEDGLPTFEGTCKVKLGPIALVYAGSGSFVDRDESARRFLVDARGRDKRGNGTAGAKVAVVMAEEAGSTRVEVQTDLAITGKPAQFGRGVMQDVSDKLLGQFVTCLEQRLSSAAPPAAAAEPAAADEPERVGAPGESAAPAASTASGESGAPAEPPESVANAGWPGPETEASAPAAPPPPAGEDSLDLGAALVPVLLRSYGKQLAAAAGALLAVAFVLRRLRR